MAMGAECKDSTEIHHGWVNQVHEEASPGVTVTRGRLWNPNHVALFDSGLSFLSGSTPYFHSSSWEHAKCKPESGSLTFLFPEYP